MPIFEEIVSEDEDEEKDRMTANRAREHGVGTKNTSREEIAEKLKGLDQTRSLRLIGLPPAEFTPHKFNQKVVSLISGRFFLIRGSVVESIIRIAEEDVLNAILQFRFRVHRNLILSQENKIGRPFGLSVDVQTPRALPIKQKQTEIHSKNPDSQSKHQQSDFEFQKKQEDYVRKKLDQTLEPEGLYLHQQDEEKKPKMTQLRLLPPEKLVIKIPPALEKPKTPPALEKAKQPETMKEAPSTQGESHKKMEVAERSKELTTKDKKGDDKGKETKKKSEKKSKISSSNRRTKDSSSSKRSKPESYDSKINRLGTEKKRRMERESGRGRLNSPRRPPGREETWKSPRRKQQPIMTSAMAPLPSGLQVDHLSCQVKELQQQMFKQQQSIGKLVQQLALTPEEDVSSKPIPPPTSQQSSSSHAKYRYEYKVRKALEEEPRPSSREKRRNRWDVEPPSKKLATESRQNLEKEDLYVSSQPASSTCARGFESRPEAVGQQLMFDGQHNFDEKAPALENFLERSDPLDKPFHLSTEKKPITFIFGSHWALVILWTDAAEIWNIRDREVGGNPVLIGRIESQYDQFYEAAAVCDQETIASDANSRLYILVESCKRWSVLVINLNTGVEVDKGRFNLFTDKNTVSGRIACSPTNAVTMVALNYANQQWPCKLFQLESKGKREFGKNPIPSIESLAVLSPDLENGISVVATENHSEPSAINLYLICSLGVQALSKISQDNDFLTFFWVPGRQTSLWVRDGKTVNLWEVGIGEVKLVQSAAIDAKSAAVVGLSGGRFVAASATKTKESDPFLLQISFFQENCNGALVPVPP